MTASDHLINVYRVEDGEEEYRFAVTVSDGSGEGSEYAVTLAQPYYVALTDEEVSPEELVEVSFQFLLERESKDEILPHFDLAVIGEYFSDYEGAIRTRIHNEA